MTQFYTYLHCKPDGTPFYVGKGSDKFSQRSHKFYGRKNPHYNRIVAKFGRDNIDVFVFHCDSEEQALSDEIQQIAQLRTEGFKLANICNGGEGVSGYSHTDETRAKISAKLKGKKLSLETCEKMAKSRLGNKNSLGSKHNLGKICSNEKRAKISATLKAKYASGELIHPTKKGETSCQKEPKLKNVIQN